uniref:Uncharacterized protein n=1 Tax=viral metagenome TaxID=1070528 RepID=A0A6C0JR96_9ZZZZ
MQEEDLNQKITYHVYKTEMDKICKSTKELKTSLLKKAKVCRIMSILVSYPIKILLGSAASGGIIEIINSSSTNIAESNTIAISNSTQIGLQECTTTFLWIVIARTVLEVLSLILVVTQDFFQFETQIEKYYAAAAAIDTFYKTVKYQSYHIKGTEGDRLDTLLEYKKLYEDIINNNQIIQTVEKIETPSPADENVDEDDIEMGDVQSEDTHLTQTRSSNNTSPRRGSLETAQAKRVTNTANSSRMMYLQTMLDRMPQ